RKWTDGAHPGGPPDQRHDALRQQRAGPLRAPANLAGLSTHLASATSELPASCDRASSAMVRTRQISTLPGALAGSPTGGHIPPWSVECNFHTTAPRTWQ